MATTPPAKTEMKSERLDFNKMRLLRTQKDKKRRTSRAASGTSGFAPRESHRAASSFGACGRAPGRVMGKGCGQGLWARVVGKGVRRAAGGDWEGSGDGVRCERSASACVHI